MANDEAQTSRKSDPSVRCCSQFFDGAKIYRALRYCAATNTSIVYPRVEAKTKNKRKKKEETGDAEAGRMMT